MNYRYSIEIRVKEFHSPFGPNVTTYEFEVTAESEAEALKIASGKVPTRGYPYDETRVRVLYSLPIFDEVALDLRAVRDSQIPLMMGIKAA